MRFGAVPLKVPWPGWVATANVSWAGGVSVSVALKVTALEVPCCTAMLWFVAVGGCGPAGTVVVRDHHVGIIRRARRDDLRRRTGR